MEWILLFFLFIFCFALIHRSAQIKKHNKFLEREILHLKEYRYQVNKGNSIQAEIAYQRWVRKDPTFLTEG